MESQGKTIGKTIALILGGVLSLIGIAHLLQKAFAAPSKEPQIINESNVTKVEGDIYYIDGYVVIRIEDPDGIASIKYRTDNGEWVTYTYNNIHVTALRLIF